MSDSEVAQAFRVLARNGIFPYQLKDDLAEIVRKILPHKEIFAYTYASDHEFSWFKILCKKCRQGIKVDQEKFNLYVECLLIDEIQQIKHSSDCNYIKYKRILEILESV